MKIITFFVCIFSLSSLLAFPVETAKPKEGDGIYKFLLSNGRDPNEHFDAFVELNKNKLGANRSLIKGVSYALPPLTYSTKTETTAPEPKLNKKNAYYVPLFGKKYEEIAVQSNKLAGATFYLVSGHGGPDCGAIGYVNGTAIHEVEYAYDITLRLARILMMEGATVHVIIQDKYNGIRDDEILKLNRNKTCRGKEIPRSQVKRLQQQCDEINTLYNRSKDVYQRAVFIHLDSRTNNQQLDVFFYYNETSPAGRKLANTMRTTFRDHYIKHQPDRGFTGTISPRNLHVLVNTQPVSLFTELGNIQSSYDQRRFLPSIQRQALAKWMCQGLIADYENSKK